jgi:DNA-directed RNA polymerase specialized sigma24 family protein
MADLHSIPGAGGGPEDHPSRDGPPEGVTERLIELASRDVPDAQIDLERQLRGLLLELVRYVKQHRAPIYNARIDSQGIPNEVFNSFLTGLRKHEFPYVRNREDVRKLLYAMVKKVLAQAIRDGGRQRRDPRREVHDEELLQDLKAPPASPNAEGLARFGPEIQGFLEDIEEMICRVHPMAMTILEKSLEGSTNSEIASELGLGLGTIAYIKKLMRQACEAGGSLRRDPEPGPQARSDDGGGPGESD